MTRYADVVQRFRLRARLVAAWRATVHEMESSPHFDMDGRRISGILAGHDEVEAAWHWIDESEACDPVREELTATEERVTVSMAESRLGRLVSTFRLGPAEVDLIQLCLAAEIDPSLDTVFAWLHEAPQRAWLTPALAALLSNREIGGIDPASALLRWALVTIDPPEGTRGRIRLDPFITSWLLEHGHVDRALAGRARRIAPGLPIASLEVDALAQRVETLLTAGADNRVRIQVVGRPDSGRRTFAAQVSRAIGLELLHVECNTPADWGHRWRSAQRVAFLDRLALCWTGTSPQELGWPDERPVPLQFVCVETEQTLPAGPGVVDLTVRLPRPTFDERRELWKRLVPGASEWPAESLDGLAARDRVRVGDIARVARTGAPDAAAAVEQLRQDTIRQLTGLATPLECTFGWADIVLSDFLTGRLKELAFEARERVRLWEEPGPSRMFPQGRGLLALFSGPPGTGKTMAAQVIAAELDLDLIRVDLSSLVSKWVGETSKNVQEVLDRASEADMVVLFDEADALFAPRTGVEDAQDRWANIDTNHLLQAIEAFPGLAILTTNRRANIDAAFLRRLRFASEFPRPDKASRRRIWERLTTEIVGQGPMPSKWLDALSEGLELTGAQIKLSVLSATFLARMDGEAVSMAHLLRGADRELEKEGVGLSARDRKRLLLRAG